MRFKTGVKNDGTITAMHLKTLLDGGAYGSYGVASTFYTGALQTVTYRIPRYRFEACRMFTNKPPCGPKRGHGTPQPRFGQEVQLDKIAEALAIDPAALRLKIVEQPGTVTANFMHVRTIGLADCIKSVVDAVATGRNASASCRTGRAWAWPARRTCRAPGFPSTGTSSRTRACSSSSTAAAGSRRSAARPRSARGPTTCWSTSSPRSWASIPSTSAP